MQSIEYLVKNALATTLQISDPLKIDTRQHLKRDLRLDSMSSLMFLMRLEDTIDGFYVDPETLQHSDLETVDSIIQYVDLQLDLKNDAIH